MTPSVGIVRRGGFCRVVSVVEQDYHKRNGVSVTLARKGYAKTCDQK